MIAAHERVVHEDLSIVSERLRDRAGAALITHIESGLERLAHLRKTKAPLAEEGGNLGKTILQQEVAYETIEEELETLVELTQKVIQTLLKKLTKNNTKHLKYYLK